MNFENEKWRNIKFEDTNRNMILSGILMIYGKTKILVK